MHFSETLQTFSQIFIAFLESIVNFKHFQKETPTLTSISEVIKSEKHAQLNA